MMTMNIVDGDNVHSLSIAFHIQRKGDQDGPVVKMSAFESKGLRFDPWQQPLVQL